MLQTLIHEYIHTLVADPYDTYAESFGSDSIEWNTLIEGVDEVFTAHGVGEARIERDGPRAARGGRGGDGCRSSRPSTSRPPPTYDAYAEAMRLVELVGIRNVIAAYFLGTRRPHRRPRAGEEGRR